MNEEDESTDEKRSSLNISQVWIIIWTQNGANKLIIAINYQT